MISVVIPTLEEATELPATLETLRHVPEINEVIVTDGGSGDATVEVARNWGAKVIVGSSGRGGQLRRGAAAATEEVIVLLHADTQVAPSFGEAIVRALEASGVCGGACYKVFRNPHWIMRGSRFRCWLRLHLWQFAYGDQALFFPRRILERMGGVPDVPLMEEYLLCRSARAFGRLVLANTVVSTSARRFQSRGVLRTYWKMAVINWRWTWGQTPEALRRYYEQG